MKNKKGWIKILEAFIAIVMLLSMLTLVINYERNESREISNIIATQSAFLIKIQENNSLREAILNVDISSGPLEMNNAGFPPSLKEYIQESFSGRIECNSKICGPLEECSLEEYPEKEIYSKSVIISSNLDLFDPRKLSLFCY